MKPPKNFKTKTTPGDHFFCYEFCKRRDMLVLRELKRSSAPISFWVLPPPFVARETGRKADKQTFHFWVELFYTKLDSSAPNTAHKMRR